MFQSYIMREVFQVRHLYTLEEKPRQEQITSRGGTVSESLFHTAHQLIEGHLAARRESFPGSGRWYAYLGMQWKVASPSKEPHTRSTYRNSLTGRQSLGP